MKRSARALRSILAPVSAPIRSLAAVMLALAATASAAAHFPWLATDDRGYAQLWFGESLADRTYHLPEKISSIDLHSAATEKPIATKLVETDQLVGIVSQLPVNPTQKIFATATYGLYHGTKLTYHVEHLPSRDPARWPTVPQANRKLQALVASADAGIAVTLWQGEQTIADQEVKLLSESGELLASRSTDDQGTVQFKSSELATGLHAVMVGLIDKQASGTLAGEEFNSTTDYLTSTFWRGSNNHEQAGPTVPRPEVDSQSGVSIESTDLPELPETLTSFGAAIASQHLYVYGGHTGEAHSYSAAEQSNRFWCLDLAAGAAGQWQPLPAGPSLQGLALVAHQNRLIRIGGFTAVNEEGAEQDLRSQAEVASFDPTTGVWTDLAPLPQPRSSHDAAVLNDTVFVVGGWKLSGSSDDSQWHDAAWSLDLSDPAAHWRALAKPPFQRRATSVAAHDGKLYVIGGMQSTGGPTTRVALYDPSTDTWSEGPSLPGTGMSGFGSAAFATGGQLIVSTMDGFVHRLAADGQSWETVAKADPARFFHRMLPSSDHELLMIGGANMEIGKFSQIDVIRLASQP
jgi:hypothetical protein